jgi:enoyl-CoA hydratase/carnithine racemase
MTTKANQGEAVTSLVHSEVQDGVALLTWDRSARHNAWTTELQADYFDALDAAVADPDVAAIVVTGAGASFCVGFDFEGLDGLSDDPQIPQERGGRHVTHPLTVPKPLIAAMNGSAAGIGFVQALLCDIRFVADGAKLTTSFARLGLVAEAGASWLLPQLVGRGRALDLLLSSRVVDAHEALAMGLVNRVVPRDEIVTAAMAYARDLAAGCAPSALAAIKAQVVQHADASWADARDESDRWTAASLREPAFAEGLAAYQERRPARFAGVTGGDVTTMAPPD